MLTAIVQARMSSSRLPGKVMTEIMGQPLLKYLVDRLRHVPEVRQIVIATTMEKIDDEIDSFCLAEKVDCYRGSEIDVLGRIYEAALEYDADPIMRITADCPLIDVAVLSNQCKYFSQFAPDYCYLDLTFAEGVCSDLFTFSALELAYGAAVDAEMREHVTPFFHANQHLLNIESIANTVDDSEFRFVLDHPEDLEVVRELILNLYTPEGFPFDTNAIKRFLNEKPKIRGLNASITRNEKYDVFDIRQ